MPDHKPKAMTLRLDDEQAAKLDTHIEQRRQDPEFMERLRRRHERDRELFERLADA